MSDIPGSGISLVTQTLLTDRAGSQVRAFIYTYLESFPMVQMILFLLPRLSLNLSYSSVLFKAEASSTTLFWVKILMTYETKIKVILGVTQCFPSNKNKAKLVQNSHTYLTINKYFKQVIHSLFWACVGMCIS